MTTVGLHNLTKCYEPDAPAVRGVSLEIGEGELVALLGPSGCGKTTILKMIAGLLSPTEGDITFDGVSVLDISPERRGAVMVFQNYLLFPYMTVTDNVGFGLRMRRVPKPAIQERVRQMLDLVRLAALKDRRPFELSGGQQQRVALARALITEPRVLLLDEPLSNLDAHLRDEMRDLILRLQRQLGITTIFVTHDQQEAMVLADRIAVIFEGVFQQYAEPRTFYERPATARLARFFGGTNFLKGVKSVDRVRTPIGSLHVDSGTAADGDVMVTIRPEAVALGSGGENVFSAVIKRGLYLGVHTRIWVDVNGIVLQMLGPPDAKLVPGETVTICLPRERLVLLSPEGQRVPLTEERQ